MNNINNFKRILSGFLIVAMTNFILGCSTLINTSITERDTNKLTQRQSIDITYLKPGKIVTSFKGETYTTIERIEDRKYLDKTPNSDYLITSAVAGLIGYYGLSKGDQKAPEGSDENKLNALGGLAVLVAVISFILSFTKANESYSYDNKVVGASEKLISTKPERNYPIEFLISTKSNSKLGEREILYPDYDGKCEFTLPLADIVENLKPGENIIVKASSTGDRDVSRKLEINYYDLKKAYENITPPDLSIIADFDDGDGYFPDKVLDATEESKLRITVENKGKGIGFDVKLNVQTNEPLVTIAGFNNYLGDMRPNEKKTIEIPLRGDEKLPTRTTSFEISAEEKNKFDAQRRKIEVKTAQLEKPLLTITNVELDDGPIGLAQGNGNGIAENGETIELVTSVKNEGVGKAINANLELVDISYGIEKVQTSERLGDIAVGKTVRGKIVVSVPRTYLSNQMRYNLRVSEVRNVGTGEKSASLEVRKQEAMLAFDFISPSKPLTNNAFTSIQIIPQNKGKLTAKNVALQVTSSNPRVIVSNGSIAIGDINAGEKAGSQSVGISLTRTFAESSIPIVIELTQSDFPPYKETKILPVTILKPNIKINAEVNRKIKQGEQGTLEISVSNKGTLAVEDVVVTIQNESIKFTDAKTKRIGKLSDSTTSEMWRIPFMLPRSVVPGPLLIIIEATQKDFPSTSLTLNYQAVEEAAFVTKIEGKKKADTPYVSSSVAEKPIISSSFYNNQTIISLPIDFRATVTAERGLLGVTAKVNGILFYDSRTDQTAPNQLQESKGKLLVFENRIAGLKNGENKITIIAYDKENEYTEKSITLMYAPEKQITSTNLDLDQSIDVENIDRIRQGKKNPNGIALVIGIEKYQSLPATLYGDRDARTMKAYLVKTFGFSEENITLLTNENATQSNIKKELRKLSNNVKADVTDVFLFYSGHGIPSKESKAKPYLAPVESEAAYIDETGILIDEIFDKFRGLKARRFTSIIDACFSGLKGGKKDPLLAAKAAYIVIESKGYLIDNGAIFYSSSGDQISTWIESKKHSVLSYYFFKGLQGEADADKNNEITFEEMEKYLREKVPSTARLQNIEQTPELISKNKTRVFVKF